MSREKECCAACGRPLPRREVRRDSVLDAWQLAGGTPRDVIADRLGMSTDAFERAMFRAKRAGDPRAVSWGRRAA